MDFQIFGRLYKQSDLVDMHPTMSMPFRTPLTFLKSESVLFLEVHFGPTGSAFSDKAGRQMKGSSANNTATLHKAIV
jgi:hypothetical protein